MSARVLNLRGAEYTISALTFGQLRKAREDIKTVSAIRGLPSDEEMDALCRLIGMGLQKEHPSLTLEQVADLVDFTNFQDVFMAVMGASGLQLRPIMPVTKEPIGEPSTPT